MAKADGRFLCTNVLVCNPPAEPESRLVCDGCNQEIDYLREGQTHEILHDKFDRFPEYCGKMIEIPAEPDSREQEYEVILADPPWKYDFSKSDSRKVENQYPTMTTEEICALDITVADNAVLYLWATAPKLLEALKVIEAWGFVYKTHAIWDKRMVGMGYWFRGQHELLLVAVRGVFSPPPPNMRVSSVIRSVRSEHSEKPKHIREIIAQSFPGKSKLELFARSKAEGWETWGDEAPTTTEPQQNIYKELFND